MAVSKTGVGMVVIGVLILVIMAVFVFGAAQGDTANALINMFVVFIEGSVIAFALFLIFLGLLLNIL